MAIVVWIISLVIVIIGIICAISAYNNNNRDYDGFGWFLNKTFWANPLQSFNAIVIASMLAFIGVLIAGSISKISTNVGIVFFILLLLIILFFTSASYNKARNDPRARNSLKYTALAIGITVFMILILAGILVVEFVSKKGKKENQGPANY